MVSSHQKSGQLSKYWKVELPKIIHSIGHMGWYIFCHFFQLIPPPPHPHPFPPPKPNAQVAMIRVGTAKLAKVNSKKVSKERVKVPKYSKICGVNVVGQFFWSFSWGVGNKNAHNEVTADPLLVGCCACMAPSWFSWYFFWVKSWGRLILVRKRNISKNT